MISLYAAGGLPAGPVGGALADRFGRRVTLLVGTAGAGALMLALGFARSTGAILVIAPLLGFFTDACRPPLQAAVADVVAPAERSRAYGLLYWAINLGFAGASVFGGVLAERHFVLLFVIDGLTTFAYGAIVFFGVPETRPAHASVAERAPAGAGLGAPFRDAPFVRFVLIQVLLLVAFAQVIVTLPLDMRAHGLGLPAIGWLLGLNGVYIVIAQPIALRTVRGLGHVQWLAAGCVLTGLGLGATAFVGGALGYALTGVLWTLGEVELLDGGARARRRLRARRATRRLPGDLSAGLGDRDHARAHAGGGRARARRLEHALGRLSRRVRARGGVAPALHGAAGAITCGGGARRATSRSTSWRWRRA